MKTELEGLEGLPEFEDQLEIVRRGREQRPQERLRLRGAAVAAREPTAEEADLRILGIAFGQLGDQGARLLHVPLRQGDPGPEREQRLPVNFGWSAFLEPKAITPERVVDPGGSAAGEGLEGVPLCGRLCAVLWADRAPEMMSVVLWEEVQCTVSGGDDVESQATGFGDRSKRG